LEEILTNIISYGCSDNPEACIQVTMSQEDQMVTIQIEDCGVPFNLLDAEQPNFECTLEEAEIGGLGIHLVKKLMNDIIYERCGDKNVVIIKKDIKEKS